MKTPTPSRQKGFTLIEVVIAVAIVAILLAIAIPSFLIDRDVSRARAKAIELLNIGSTDITSVKVDPKDSRVIQVVYQSKSITGNGQMVRHTALFNRDTQALRGANDAEPEPAAPTAQ
jgi:prepilin-type N-terminal cleavage/methylation domain-containing protein